MRRLQVEIARLLLNRVVQRRLRHHLRSGRERIGDDGLNRKAGLRHKTVFRRLQKIIFQKREQRQRDQPIARRMTMRWLSIRRWRRLENMDPLISASLRAS